MSDRQSQLEMVAILRKAHEAPIGIELEFATPDDMRRYRQKLYAVRRKHPEFQHLRLTDRGANLWIVKGQTPDE